MNPNPLKWPEPEIFFHEGERVEYREPYADLLSRLSGQRGTVVVDAPLSLVTGVTILWDKGEMLTVSCLSVRKLGVLDLMAEI
jgi:hypothetical protein